MGRLTTKEFIKGAQKVHGDRYDYSLVNYINNATKVAITCLEHGMFMQAPNHHKKGSGCSKCANNKKSRDYSLTTSEFIDRAIGVHGDTYDYSLAKYKNNRIKIIIICSNHGTFKQTPGAHLMSQGCPECNIGQVKLSEVLNRIKKVHGDKYIYDLSCYSKINDKFEIDCKVHGIFNQRMTDHLNGSECPRCADRIKLTTNEFIRRAKAIHKDRYDYSLVEYTTNKVKVKIICPKHGEFMQTPNSHCREQGCPSCKESKGERSIAKFLKEKDIKFIRQYKFDKCKNKRCLPFDFYLPNHNMCIEFNGRQHYEPVAAFGGVKSFKEIQKNDDIKYDYCKNNNIKLMSIKYNEDIDSKFNTLLNLCK